MEPKYFVPPEGNESILIDKRASIRTRASESGSLTFKRYFGNNKVFWWYKNEPLCSLGVHYKIFFGCFVVFVFIGLFVLFFVANIQKPKIRYSFAGLVVLEALIYLYIG